jgi:hypothetical protein
LAVASFSRSPVPTNRTTLIQALFNLMPSMRQFGGKDHLPRCLVDKSQSRGSGAWIKFDAQGLDYRIRNLNLQDNGKRESPEDGRPTLFQ